MERFSSLIDNVKERLTNPFVFSYVVSWLTINWRITIGLIWFDDFQLRSTGNFNYKDYIINHVVDWSWLYAAVAAGVYTFGVPYAMMYIRIFNAWIIKESNSKVFDISKETPISFEKFIELKDRYRKSTDAYAKLLTEESKTLQTLENTKATLNQHLKEKNESDEINSEMQRRLIEEQSRLSDDYSKNIAAMDTQMKIMKGAFDELNKENEGLKEKDKESTNIVSNLQRKLSEEKDKLENQLEENRDLDQEVQKLKSILDVNRIDGKWDMRIGRILSNPNEIDLITINNGSMIVQNNTYTIWSFTEIDRSVSFVIDKNGDGTIEYYTLRINDQRNIMHGKLNNKVDVIFAKRS